VTIGDWSGAGWIELDGSGNAGFMISGGTAGGSTSDTGRSLRSVESNPTPGPNPGGAPPWEGGHPTLLDYLFTAMLGKVVDYHRVTVSDPRIPSGYRDVQSGEFATPALGEAENEYVATLGSMGALVSGLWLAVWQVINDVTGPNASKYLEQDLVLRRAILSFCVGSIGGLASFTALLVPAAFDIRVWYAPLVAGLAVGFVVSYGWSAIKQQVFQDLQMEPQLDGGLRIPRFGDDTNVPDLSDPVRSVELVSAPSYW
jgi:hypothetical protein